MLHGATFIFLRLAELILVAEAVMVLGRTLPCSPERAVQISIGNHRPKRVFRRDYFHQWWEESGLEHKKNNPRTFSSQNIQLYTDVVKF